VFFTSSFLYDFFTFVQIVSLQKSFYPAQFSIKIFSQVYWLMIFRLALILMEISFFRTFLSLCYVHINPLNRLGCALVNNERKRLISFNVKWEKPLSLSACKEHKNLTFGRFNIAPETRRRRKKNVFHWMRELWIDEKTSFLFISIPNLLVFLLGYDMGSVIYVRKFFGVTQNVI
jgi:hypothetical protein